MYVLVLCCSVLFLCSLIVDREPHSFWQRVLSQPSHPLLATLKFLDVTPLLLPVGKTGHSSKVSPQNAAHYYHTYLQLLLPPRETQVDELSCNPLLLRVSATYVRIKPLAAASGTSNRLAALISRYIYWQYLLCRYPTLIITLYPISPPGGTFTVVACFAEIWFRQSKP